MTEAEKHLVKGRVFQALRSWRSSLIITRKQPRWGEARSVAERSGKKCGLVQRFILNENRETSALQTREKEKKKRVSED